VTKAKKKKLLLNARVYSLRLSQRVRNITTVMGNYISSTKKKAMRYGESSNG
tara:strand:- start:5533 stop:5688 length:156 start_codon:yes stop_codon:yes gene_type:complete